MFHKTSLSTYKRGILTLTIVTLNPPK